MKKFFVLLLLLTVFGIGAVILRPHLFSNDADRIKAAIVTLAEILGKPAAESPARALVQCRSAADCFAESAVIVIPQIHCSGVFNHADRMSNVAGYRGWLQSAVITVDEIAVTLSAGDRAEAAFSGCFRGVGKSGEKIVEAADVTTRWRKLHGEWKITELTVSPVLH